MTMPTSQPSVHTTPGDVRSRLEGTGPFEGVRILQAVTLVIGAACGAVFLGGAPVEEAVRACIRLTAATSAVPLILVFSAAALRRRWPTPVTRWMVRNRRQLGLSVAISHVGFHAGFIVFLYALGAGGETSLVTVIGGGFGLACLAAMAATSTDAAQRKLGRYWRRLHLFCLYVAWAIFTFSYLGGALAGHARATVITAALIVALALRWLPARSKNEPGTPPGPAGPTGQVERA